MSAPLAVSLSRPELAWLALAAPLLLGVGLWGLAARRREQARLVVAVQLERFLPRYSHGRALARAVLAGLAVLLLAVALMGPVHGSNAVPVVRRGLDLALCIDTSRSMLAEDVRPSRFERAKREVRGLLERLGGDRVCLVAFSGDARDISPLTHDTSALEGFLRYVSIEDNRMGGTDLGNALEHALELFDGREGAHEAIVLITDGEDLTGRGREVAERAATRGIRVFVVGVGTAAGGKIPVVGADGSQSFLVGPEGEEVLTALDDTSLRALAESTGGEYLSVEQSPTPLEELFEKRISVIEGYRSEEGFEEVPNDRYQLPLALALVCMLLELGLRERRAPRDPAARARLNRSGDAR